MAALTGRLRGSKITYWKLEKSMLVFSNRHGRAEIPASLSAVSEQSSFTAESQEKEKWRWSGLLLFIPGVATFGLGTWQLFRRLKKIPVLVNRGWVPRSWRNKSSESSLKATSHENMISSEKDKSKGGPWWKFWLKEPANVKDVDSYFKMVKVIGVVRGSENPNIFMPLNDPISGQWFYVDVPAIARAVGLPENALYVEEIEEAHTASNPYPLPKDASTFVRYSVMPQDHLNYALTWYALSAATTFMAKKRLQKKKSLR